MPICKWTSLNLLISTTSARILATCGNATIASFIAGSNLTIAEVLILADGTQPYLKIFLNELLAILFLNSRSVDSGINPESLDFVWWEQKLILFLSLHSDVSWDPYLFRPYIFPYTCFELMDTKIIHFLWRALNHYSIVSQYLKAMVLRAFFH